MHTADDLDILSLVGVVAPLILSNISHRTRDANLLYHSIRFAVDVCSLPRVPIGTGNTFRDLIQAWGVDGRLLHDVESQPIVMSDTTGTWVLLTGKEKNVPVSIFSLLASRSDLDVATQLVLRLAALLGNRASVLGSCIGITAALWRQKRQDAYKWTEALNDIEIVADGPRDDQTQRNLDALRNWMRHRENTNYDDNVLSSLAFRARAFCCLLLSCVPIAHFEASNRAAQIIALLATPQPLFHDELTTVGLILKVLYSIGLTGAKARRLFELTRHEAGNGGDDAFREDYLQLHKELTFSLRTGDDTARALVNLRRNAHAHKDVVADVKTHAHNPDVRVEILLESLCSQLPRETTKLVETDPNKAFDTPTTREVLKNLNLDGARLVAALAGAGAAEVIRGPHRSGQSTTSPRKGQTTADGS